ncbi:bifunctional diaminohydroxyphosphoribosylaminopyrimidine deaminase/5-amino-6-(5-phosphoribosylamino)uracil reductase RibD [Thermoflavimicrobium daqui]|jgi:diaminohydroxyphosphoribosylaminopyrimidine deaminase/5-amino-6-(5-phosphoribosylamino)uracil reductase|uniref:Riboflavin biosynthesis protein RibD n=1 Tax=Thermoflavimicrobium daqui TaxID=2137476 RepID=A0A364K871_9BACL|nr:bifunctional diaminohydroxyphosphoribosylaminopyrimidine deaminase/5-amino-6-(5-phosphoribosylamino)uracil reductase RibD [Thermoflavimicrobium daqui]RAL26499.1 bifunctional diaminohydroxyphosphoribosylaminopyrimidine deaminase/5-amino-6-(5-phosphoribosylamino)uracil reductase RibD [Thermoflavimicrobium daqui]
MQTHEDWMHLAWQLAKSTAGQTAPNPMVGACVVKDGRLVGLGSHLQAGTAHAEVHALNMAQEKAQGSTLYVTLEPCNHYGRTPPCTEKIITSGVKRVVVGSLDPDPLVAGKGIQRLQEAGIEVIQPVYEEACIRLNEAYFHHRHTGYPFVTLKTAMTLDGKIATHVGDSQWITNEKSRQKVHQLRHQHDAILVGVGTVLADNPRLTARLEVGGIQPIRVVVDSHLRTPIDSNITDVTEAKTWIFTTDAKDQQKEQELIAKGVKVISTGAGSQVDLEVVLQTLGDHGILSLLVEGGGEVNASFLHGNHVQKVIAFIAPKLLGGRNSPTSIEGENPEKMKESKELKDITIERFGDDLCIIGYI